MSRLQFFPFYKDSVNGLQLQECIGAAVIAMGPEELLELLPISLNAEDFTCSNIWLIPILKKFITGASLGFFVEHVVPLAESFARASHKGTCTIYCINPPVTK